MTTIVGIWTLLYLIPVVGMVRVCKAIHDWFFNHPRLETDLEKVHVGKVHLGGLLIAVVLAGVSTVCIFSPYLVANTFPLLAKIGLGLDLVYTCVTIWTGVEVYNHLFGKKTPDGK